MSLAPVSPFHESDEPFEVRGRDASRYFDRELSWLAFNRRVLEEACNGAHPLLERLRFLSIAGSNLDEFFMVRVAGLMRQRQEEVKARVADAPAVSRHLAEVIAEADRLMESQQAVWRDLRSPLAASGVAVLDAGGIAEPDEAVLAAYFREQLFPVLTPQAIDPSHPFPFIPNKGLSVLFDLVRVSTGEAVREVVMLPATMPRFVRLAGQQARYVAVETVLRHFAALLFPGYRVERSATFRVLRDSDLEIEEEAEDLVRYFANAIKRRRRGRVIRLELETGTPEELAVPLRQELGGASGSGKGGGKGGNGASGGGAMVTDSGDFLGLDDLALLVEEDRPGLKFPIFTPRFPERIREFDGDCFAAIRAKDIVVHHPYETFDVVLAFLKQAAADPDVVAIKQTLYRAGQAAVGDQRADRGGRGGQVGDGGGRAEGALRRGTEHPLGLRLGTGGGCASSMAFSSGRPMPRCRWWCGARGRRFAPTAISAPATITRSPPASIPTSASSPPIARSARTRRRCSTTSPAISSRWRSSGWCSARATCARR